MKKYSILIISVLLVCEINLVAQPLVSVDELAKLYKSKDHILVSTRSNKDYTQFHITNAINLYHKSLYKSGIELKGKLAEPENLYKKLGKTGLDPTKTIILYDAKTGKYAARVFWVLDYLGYKDVKILDGQLEAWKAERKPVTAMVKTAKKADVSPLTPEPSKIASIDEVEQAINSGSALLIDAREPVEFNGTEGHYAKKGHLPGAVNLPFNEVLKKGTFVDKSQLMKILGNKNIDGSKPVIVYCNTGILASSVYIALKYIAGFGQVKVYDGSFEEWVEQGKEVE